ncbi:MAG: VCBS repeat-containing protein [Planctomycetes bacterium]|nr:VCBS repeat-containing protein [Planctomycetota bacterium]
MARLLVALVLAIAASVMILSCGPTGIGLLINESSGSNRTTEVIAFKEPIVTQVSIPSSSAIDLNRAILKATVTIRVFNGNFEKLPAKLDVEYQVNDSGLRKQATIEAKGANSALDVELAPDSITDHVVVWNIATDIGLGIDSRQGINTARLYVKATAKNRAGQDVASNTQVSNATILQTNPFRTTRTTLADGYVRLISNASNPYNRSLQIFLTQRGAVETEQILIPDQQFATIVVPDLKPLQLTDPTENFANTLPVDFEPDTAIACMTMIRGKLEYIRWPRIPSASATRDLLPASEFSLLGEDFQSATMPSSELALASKSFALIPSYTQNPTNAREREVFLQLVEFSQATKGARPRLKAVTNGTVSLTSEVPATYSGLDGYYPFLVDVDTRTDVTDKAYVLATAGTHGSDKDGFMNLFRVSTADAGQSVTWEVTRLPTLPDLPFDEKTQTRRLASELARSDISTMQVKSRPGRPNIVIVEEFRGNAKLRKERYAYILTQDANGKFADAWTEIRLPDDSVGTEAQHTLTGISGKDIDQDGNGDLLVFLKRSADQRRARVELLLLDLLAAQPSAEIRPLMTDVATEGSAATMRLEFADPIDVNGDGLIDLMVKDFDNNLNPKTGKFSYFSSTLSGVPTGLAEIRNAGSIVARQPGLFDVNGDNLPDLINGGAIYTGREDDTFELLTGGLKGGPTNAVYWPEQLSGLAGARPEFIEVLAYVPAAIDGHVVNYIGRTNDQISVRDVARLDTSARTLWFTRPLLGPSGTLEGVEKRLLAVLGDTSSARFYTATRTVEFNAQTNANESIFRFDSQPLVSNVVSTEHVALVRSGQLLDVDMRYNKNRQHIFALEGGGSDKIIYLEAHTNYQTPVIWDLFPAQETVIGIQAASVTSDSREDLVVATAADVAGKIAYRVYYFPQGDDGKFATPDKNTLDAQRLMQFESVRPVSGTSFLALGFDQGTGAYASGLFLTQQDSRMIIPEISPLTGRFSARMVRSPLENPPQRKLSLVVADENGDGLLEAIAGTEESSPRLLRLERSYQ